MMPPHLPDADRSFRTIRLLCSDVDGVLTDGGLYYGPTGVVLSRFHVLDGQGLKAMRQIGVATCFVTMSDNEPIRRRARDLGIDHCLTGIPDKIAAVGNLIAGLGLEWTEVAHIGDDTNDLELLQRVGLPVTVPNAVEDVAAVCRYVTRRSGGQGAVRELCDALLRSQSA